MKIDCIFTSKRHGLNETFFPPKASTLIYTYLIFPLDMRFVVPLYLLCEVLISCLGFCISRETTLSRPKFEWLFRLQSNSHLTCPWTITEFSMFIKTFFNHLNVSWRRFKLNMNLNVDSISLFLEQRGEKSVNNQNSLSLQ